MDYQPFLQAMLEESSKIANKRFGKVSGILKDGDSNQVLTEADLAIGKFIIEAIKKDFPEHNIIDEEAGVIDNKSEFTWVIDPIDGTSNFEKGIFAYGVMIGLLWKNIPYAGGIALPAFSQIATAQKDKGAFSDNKKLAVTNEKKLLNVLVAYHIDGHQEYPNQTRDEVKVLGEIILAIRNLRIFESCLDTILLVQGKIGGYLNRTSKIWDNVAPQIIVEEAGGLYTDFFGKPIDYSQPLTRVRQNFTACAAAPQLHMQLQAVIHKATH